MKVSHNWLKQFIDLDLGAEEIAGLLTDCGLEVESYSTFETIKGGLKGVVTGKVVGCEKHPNADKLSLTTVDVGEEAPLHIVCGAPNVAAGQTVLVARIGTTLYKGEESFVIREAKIRGSLSQGMICAEDELGLGDSHEGILVLPDSVKPGMPASQYFDLYTDVVFEIGLTPNRSDAFSHGGVARDLLAVLKRNEAGKYKNQVLQWPLVDAFPEDISNPGIMVEILDPEACPRYCGLTLEKLRVGESPAWMQHLLRAAGLRPINVVVDITNYVMLETGQPLHAFDVEKIKGGKVVVKKLAAGTRFTTLDGIERTLSGEELMICNGQEAMCMAGVYGGLDAGVTTATTGVFLESAYFNPVAVRKASRVHALKTDSSQRFERGANPDMTIYAIKRAALLMQEYAGAVICSSIQDVYPTPVLPFMVRVSFTTINRLIGKTISPGIVKEILENLEITVIEENDEGMLLSVPPFKTDVQREADVIEEILRVYGYNNIPLAGEIRYSMVSRKGMHKEMLRGRLSDLLSARGFSEIMCNSLSRAEYKQLSASIPPASYVQILNPLSRDLEVMRRSLLFGGLETLVFNLNRRVQDLKIYEFGSAYEYLGDMQTDKALQRYREEEYLAVWLSGKDIAENWYQPARELDFFALKATVQLLLDKAGITKSQYRQQKTGSDLFREGLEFCCNDEPALKLLEMGEVSPLILKAFDIKQTVFFAAINWASLLRVLSSNKLNYNELPRFPWVRRDLALLLDKSVSFEDIEKLAYQTETVLLKSVNLFDVYEGQGIGEGKKSYAVSFVLQDQQKTLTDEQIDQTMDRLVRKFEQALGASLR